MRALGIDDDPSLVVDEIVWIVSKEWVGALLCDSCPVDRSARLLSEPCADCRHRSHRCHLRCHSLITAGGIEDREVLANRTGCLLGLAG